MVKIILGGLDRKYLGEGRQTGLGSTLCKKTGEDEYTTLLGITTCKDYLHDILGVELTGKQCGSFGFKYDKCGGLDGDQAYLLLKMCSYKNKGEIWAAFETQQNLLANNFQNIALFLNHFEKEIGISLSTIEAVDDMFLVISPHFWVETTYLISLYTLLVRCGLFYDGQLSVTNYVKQIRTQDYFEGEGGEDLGLLRGVLPKYEVFLKRGFPKENLAKKIADHGLTGGWHDKGIHGLSLTAPYLEWPDGR